MNNRVKKIVKECGISKAYDSSSRTYNPDFKTLDLFQIPRLSIWNIDSLKSLKIKYLESGTEYPKFVVNLFRKNLRILCFYFK